MKLHVISSSSAGNCYVLESEASALVIECGASPETMFARTGIDARKFVGAVVTHEHGDHAAHIGKYADRAIDVYASRGTLAACHIDKAYRAHALRPMQSVTVGDFVVRAFDVKHDAAEPFGYIIEHEECGKVLFATDTHFIRYNFKSLRLNHILIEANYSQEELDDNIARGGNEPGTGSARANVASINRRSVRYGQGERNGGTFDSRSVAPFERKQSCRCFCRANAQNSPFCACFRRGQGFNRRTE